MKNSYFKEEKTYNASDVDSYLEKMEGYELDKIVLEYMKRKKLQRSSTLFESNLKLQPKNCPSKSFSDLVTVMRRFKTYLLESENRKQNELDDLGFEINFGVIPTPRKV